MAMWLVVASGGCTSESMARLESDGRLPNEGLFEGNGHDATEVWMGDGQTEAKCEDDGHGDIESGVPILCRRGDALLRRMLPHLIGPIFCILHSNDLNSEHYKAGKSYE